MEFLSVYLNLNYKYHKINPKKSLLKTSLFEYIGTKKGECICDVKMVSMIINKLKGVSGYKKYLRGQSEYFTNQEGFIIGDLDFEELEDL